MGDPGSGLTRAYHVANWSQPTYIRARKKKKKRERGVIESEGAGQDWQETPLPECRQRCIDQEVGSDEYLKPSLEKTRARARVYMRP